MNVNTTDNNIITSYNGIDIYTSDIDVLCSEYEKQYNNVEDIKTKSVFFNGLMVYLNVNLFKNITNKNYNNDYEALNAIFYKCFVPLCVRYSRTPTLLNFCCMTGLSNTNLSDIVNGNYRDGSKVNTETSETVKKWKATCEAALFDSGMSGNPVMAIFGLKAAHNWSDQQIQRLEIVSNGTQSTPEQIAERYKDVKKPEIPVLDEL